MSHEEFRALVATMRDLQKQYFAGRSTMTLEACKKAERLVDEALNPPKPKPKGLFDDEAQGPYQSGA
jgi:hypothetical protein